MIRIGDKEVFKVNLYGACEQSGTPSPDTPIDIVCNNGVLKVSPQGQIYTDGTQETITDNKGNTANAEMLLSVGDYKDTQEVLSGNVTRNVGIKVLDGTEDWRQSPGDAPYITTISDMAKPSSSDGNMLWTLNTHFKVVSRDANWSMYDNLCSTNTAQNRVQFRYLKNQSTLENFKTFLANQYANGTPVIVVYPLAQPTTETVTPQLLSGSVVTQTAGSIPDMDIDLIKRPAELINKFITDSNGVPHKVISTFVGNKIIYNTEPVIYNDTNAEFYKRQTANGAIEDTDKLKCAIKEVRGKSIVWNQLLKRNTKSGDTINGVTFTYNSDGTIIANGTAIDSTYGAVPYYDVKTIANHKYLLFGGIDDQHLIVDGNGVISSAGMPVIKTFTSSMLLVLSIVIRTNATADNLVFKPMFFDLTLMFGAGNEPATVEEFEKMFPFDYYEYNAGEVIPFAGQNLVTTGFNQWDEQYVNGYYEFQSGRFIQTPTSYCSKNPIKVIGGQKYNVSITNNVGVIYYDSSMNYITGGWYVGQRIAPDNACYMHVNFGTAAPENVCVNISNEDRNGTYEPYEKHTLPLDPSQWRDKQGNLVFPYGGMHGVGTAYDYAKVDADGYIRKAVRCFGQVDLGTLIFEREETSSYYRFKTSNIAKVRGKALCPIYKQGNTDNQDDRTFAIATFYIYVRDDSYSDPATFKTAMQGVPLYYELAEPVEVELATPIYAKYLVDKDGTEEITPENGSTPYTTMATMNLIYSERKDN